MLRCLCRFCRDGPTVKQGWVSGWGMIELPSAPIAPDFGRALVVGGGIV